MHTHRAFTMTEILVTATILVVLASIAGVVYPSLRDTARSAACLSNVRQLSMANCSYAIDQRGFMPYARFHSETYNPDHTLNVIHRTFADLIQDYLPKQGNGADVRIVQTCPQSRINTRIIQWPLTYGANLTAHGEYSYYVQWNAMTAVNINRTRINRPSEIISFADTSQSSGAGTGGGWIEYSNYWELATAAKADTLLETGLPVWSSQGNTDKVNGGIYRIRYRHHSNQLAGVAYVDGHASLSSIQELRFRNLAITY